MEYVEMAKTQVLYYVEHYQEYLDEYTDFFNSNILDIKESFYPDDDMSPKIQTRNVLITTAGVFLFALVLLSVLTSVLSKIFSSGSSRSKETKKCKTSCMLVGESGAGKTALFSRLIYGPNEVFDVHTSTAPNDGVWMHDQGRRKRGVGIIDVPGNKKVSGCWREILTNGSKGGVPAPSGIVFVIDASTFNSSKSVVSDTLYDILSDDHIIRKCIPVHIFCNKNDLPGAFDMDSIKTDLEIELTLLRNSYVTSDNFEKDIMDSDDDNAEFSFDSSALVPVSFSIGSARRNDMNDLLEFISNPQ